MAKEGKNRFELGKGSERKFDLGKGSKRKFDLKKDVGEAPATVIKTPDAATAPAPEPKATTQQSLKPAPAATQVHEPQAIGGNDTNEPRKNNTWLWILLALIVIGALIWLFVAGGDKKSNVPAAVEEEVEAVEVVDSVPEDCTLPAEEVSEASASETAPEDVPATVPEDAPDKSETPAKSEASVASSAVNSTVATPSVPSSRNETVIGDIEAEANKVIRGDYGVGQERKDRLGSNYKAIQSRVNEILR